jgi:hypothetical protein
LVVSDGTDEYVRVVSKGKTLKGAAVRSQEKNISAEEERLLLIRNYKCSLSQPESVAKRKAWVLILSPVVPGKPEQRCWVDQSVGALLKVTRAFPDEQYEMSSSFIDFDPTWVPQKKDFQWVDDGGGVKEHELYPDFLTMEELNKLTGNKWSPAKELPAGFVFESADYYGARKSPVLHWRYTDGLAVVSLFRTDGPVGSGKGSGGESLAQDRLPGSLRLTGTMHSYTWKKGTHHYTLVSDLSRPLLKKIAAQFE